MSASRRLDRDDIELLAKRVAELIQTEVPPRPSVRLLDAADVARMLAVDRDWVYAHARELGAVRLGGEHGRLRFDLARIEQHLATPEPKRPRLPQRGIRRRPGSGAAPSRLRSHLRQES